MKRGEGQQIFSGIGTLLKKRGYKTLFFLTHDPHFDNMQGFLITNDFEQVIGQHDYPGKEVVSSLGVPDHVMFSRGFEELDKLEEPFLAMFLTGSHHGPFIVPDDKPFRRFDEGQPQSERYNAFSYADWSLGWFHDQVMKTEWGARTLFTVTGDHGVVLNHQNEMDLSLFHVPLLMISEDRIEPGVSSRAGGQKDIVATVMDALGGAWINNTLGNSLLMDKGIPHALFIEGRQTGFIMKDLFYFDSGVGARSELFELGSYLPSKDNSALADKMAQYSKGLLAATHYLVKSRMVGLPAE